MSEAAFDEFFKAAMGSEHAPYGYQCRLACGPDADPNEPKTLRNGTDCQSQLINIPTGLGKTAAVTLAWLWNRVYRQKPNWPRRLVYCLPMRTLVEQTRDEAQKWTESLTGKNLMPGKPPRIVILMGGEELEGDARDWDIYPEENAILIGTQDMLLSRALNRGYGMSRYRWPMHFGLLNNDCLWVMDETQLMGVGVETSSQLDGFRQQGKMQTIGPCLTWWMSATLDESRLATVDHPKPEGDWPTTALSDSEKTSGRPYELITSKKKLSSAPIVLNSTTKASYAKDLAAFIKNRHQIGTLTLVVVNRVARAREIYEALTTGKKPIYNNPECVALIHSRFRPKDRKRHEDLLFGQGDRIVIATQAVEAGVDVSARLLITELAPWSSLVQRMGRCNRRADIPDAEVHWVNIDADAKNELLLPYLANELLKARDALLKISNGSGDVSPGTLTNINVDEEPVIRPVIRRRDLVDLFDTTPDVCGQDLDISRYIRDGEDNDVQFFWREIATDAAPTREDKPPQRIELCRVAIGDAAKFLDKSTTRAWRWNPLDRKWEEAKNVRPGGIYLLALNGGGYHDDLGWTGEPKHKPTPHPPNAGILETYQSESDTFSKPWQTIAEHTKFVVQETAALAALTNDPKFIDALCTAALWHDIGKAHHEFQKALRDGRHQPPDCNGLYAKSENLPKRYNRDRPYRSIRHELASALAWLLADTPHAPGKPGSRERDLVAYLIAAHHGKVRLSIRSLPDEKGNPGAPVALFARGVWQNDKLPSVPLGELTTPEILLDLNFMQMGEGKHGASWLTRTIALRDLLGLFGLAYLETLLRAADARASRKND